MATKERFVLLEIQPLDEDDGVAEWKAFSTVASIRGRSARRAIYLRAPTSEERKAVALALRSWDGTAYVTLPIVAVPQEQRDE